MGPKLNKAPKKIHSKSLLGIINLLQSVIDEAITQNPWVGAQRFKYSCDSAIRVYEDLKINIKVIIRKIKQSWINDFMKKNEKKLWK